jgi:retron-type reverse transcriptase
MKTYSYLYDSLCTRESIEFAYKKARKDKASKQSVMEFDASLKENLEQLHKELNEMIYEPKPLKRLVVRDPKTRTIHASYFRDRIVHHLVVNTLEPIFEKIFIYDSCASRKNKGAHLAISRLEQFMRKISQNGRAVRGEGRSKNNVQGYILKADIRKYFDNVNHKVLINIIKRKVKDGKIIWLIRKILNNFNTPVTGQGMPLGNYTSQFFANVYLNELDYFVKHELKAKYYIRYVDDFVILHRSKKRLEYFKKRITEFLKGIKLELHPDKSNIIPLRNGLTFLGYKVFYHHKLLIKRNIHSMMRKIRFYKEGSISFEEIYESFQGWEAYAKWSNSYKLRNKVKRQIVEILWNKI